MKQSEKELLLKDLSVRIPYGVWVYDSNEGIKGLLNSVSANDRVDYMHDNGFSSVFIQDIKPYLRPMESITEEEEKKLKDMLLKVSLSSIWTYEHDTNVIVVDFYNSHHLDYRGLIPKGLALEAPSNMYKFE